MADWIIYYEGGASFSSDDGPPEAAPRWGVLMIAVADADVGRHIIYGPYVNFYVWLPGIGWQGCYDIAGLMDYLCNRPGREKIVLNGRWVSTPEIRSAYAVAKADPRLPPKSAMGLGEHGGG